MVKRLASLGSWGKDKASLQEKCDGQQDLTRHGLLQEASSVCLSPTCHCSGLVWGQEFGSLW